MPSDATTIGTSPAAVAASNWKVTPSGRTGHATSFSYSCGVRPLMSTVTVAPLSNVSVPFTLELLK